MSDRKRSLFRLLLALAPAIFLLLAAGCTSDQSTFDTAGDVAQRQRDLLVYWVLGPATVILVLVQVALIYIMVRYRRRQPNDIPEQTHGNTRLEIAWTIAPTLLLAVIAVPTVDGIIDLGRAPAQDALKVNVIGQQFSWSFEYPDITDSEGNVLTVVGTPDRPGEMHIPVDTEISATMQSLDVVHSFWVPRLAGKLDVVPGRNNRMWFNATEPGSYTGQCAEFCGLQHADMRMVVVAESQADFDAWVEDQISGAAAEREESDASTVAAQGE